MESSPALLQLLRSYPFLIAVDGGLRHCLEWNLRPHWIIGDLDSADPALLRACRDVPVYTLPHDKDQTDLQAALELLNPSNACEVALFGALGGRLDLTLSNIQLLSLWPTVLRIEDRAGSLFRVDALRRIPCSPGQTVSLIALNGPASGIDTAGLKWNLRSGELNAKAQGVSNVCLGHEFSLSCRSGDLLCWMQHA